MWQYYIANIQHPKHRLRNIFKTSKKCTADLVLIAYEKFRFLQNRGTFHTSNPAQSNLHKTSQIYNQLLLGGHVAALNQAPEFCLWNKFLHWKVQKF